jgi:hypothetical protein
MSLSIADIHTLIDVHLGIARQETDRWSKYLQWYLNRFRTSDTQQNEGDDVELNEHTNYLFALVDTISASLVPLNPNMHARPESPDAADRALVVERLLRQDIKATRLRKVSRRCIRRTVLFGRAPAKVVWDELIQAPRVYDVKPEWLWWNFEVPFEQSPYYIEYTTVPDEEMQRRLKRPKTPDGRRPAAIYNRKGLTGQSMKGGPHWLRTVLQSNTTRNLTDKVEELFSAHVVYEIYFPREDRCVHLMPGAEVALYDGPAPYGMVPNPYAIVSFHDRLEDERGLSDAELIDSLQFRMNELSQLAMEHILRSMPWMAYDRDAVDKDSIEALEEAAPGDLVGVSVRQGKTVRDAFAEGPTPSLTPDFYRERSRIQEDIQLISGFPDWARGRNVRAEVATEVALQESALKTRFTQREQDVADFHAEIGNRMLLLRREMMPEDQKVWVPSVERFNDALTDHGDPVWLTSAHLEGVRDVDVVPYDPQSYNKPMRREALKGLVGLLKNTGLDAIADMPRLMRLIIQLHEEDPSVISSGPMAPADAVAADAAMATGMTEAAPGAAAPAATPQLQGLMGGQVG